MMNLEFIAQTLCLSHCAKQKYFREELGGTNHMVLKAPHKIPLNEMINKMTKLNMILRNAIIEKITIKEVLKYNLNNSEPEKIKPSLKDIITMSNQFCVSFDIVKEYKNKYKTLGDLIDFLVSNKCEIAGNLINALLPYSDEYLTFVNEQDLPHQKTWIFAWQMVNRENELFLRK